MSLLRRRLLEDSTAYSLVLTKESNQEVINNIIVVNPASAYLPVGATSITATQDYVIFKISTNPVNTSLSYTISDITGGLTIYFGTKDTGDFIPSTESVSGTGSASHQIDEYNAIRVTPNWTQSNVSTNAAGTITANASFKVTLDKTGEEKTVNLCLKGFYLVCQEFRHYIVYDCNSGSVNADVSTAILLDDTTSFYGTTYEPSNITMRDRLIEDHKAPILFRYNNYVTSTSMGTTEIGTGTQTSANNLHICKNDMIAYKIKTNLPKVYWTSSGEISQFTHKLNQSSGTSNAIFRNTSNKIPFVRINDYCSTYWVYFKFLGGMTDTSGTIADVSIGGMYATGTVKQTLGNIRLEYDKYVNIKTILKWTTKSTTSARNIQYILRHSTSTAIVGTACTDEYVHFYIGDNPTLNSQGVNAITTDNIIKTTSSTVTHECIFITKLPMHAISDWPYLRLVLYVMSGSRLTNAMTIAGTTRYGGGTTNTATLNIVRFASSLDATTSSQYSGPVSISYENTTPYKRAFGSSSSAGMMSITNTSSYVVHFTTIQF